MLDAAAKAVFHSLARIELLKRLASRYGLSEGGGGFARRFIAGESIEEAVAAVKPLSARGLLLTLDYLGESVATTDEADQATREYRKILQAIAISGIERNVSIKLTQLGLDVDRATCLDNIRRILDPAVEHGFFVRIDMESSAYTDDTLQVFEIIWGLGYQNIGVVLQSYLMRTPDDARRVMNLGARIRLVKGAYKEPKTVAFQKKSDVDEAFVRLMQTLLDNGGYHAIATHDPVMIDATKAYAAEKGYARDRFEFQMLYGIRRDLQAALSAEGYPMRIYVPFGEQWFAYFMRRLGERPANIGFVLRGLFREQ